MMGVDLSLLVGALSFTQGCNGIRVGTPVLPLGVTLGTGAGTYRALNDKGVNVNVGSCARGASGLAFDSAIRRTPLSGQSLG